MPKGPDVPPRNCSRAQDSGDPYELAHTLTWLGVTFAYSNDIAQATTTLDEAVRVARDAGVTAPLAMGLSTLAQLLPIEEADRALALLDEAVELGTRTGDRTAVWNATTNRGYIAARLGDWQTALRDQADTAELMLEAGALMAMFGCFWGAGIALCGLDHFETAAVLIGKADAMSDRYGIQWEVDLLEATDATLLATLGEQHLATLAARGAALEIPDTVAYLRAETNRALTAP